jgi:hypothetical protein
MGTHEWGCRDVRAALPHLPLRQTLFSVLAPNPTAAGRNLTLVIHTVHMSMFGTLPNCQRCNPAGLPHNAQRHEVRHGTCSCKSKIRLIKSGDPGFNVQVQNCSIVFYRYCTCILKQAVSVITHRTIVYSLRPTQVTQLCAIPPTHNTSGCMYLGLTSTRGHRQSPYLYSTAPGTRFRSSFSAIYSKGRVSVYPFSKKKQQR